VSTSYRAGLVATLRFSFGTMGSGKSTMALQIHHNLASRGLRGLLLTQLDRDGSQVTSRLGVSAPAVEVAGDLDLFEFARTHQPLDYLVCDEAQFFTADQVDQLARVVDELQIDVFAFGILTDFRSMLFEGSARLVELADRMHVLQVEALCWCGKRATHNARTENGVMVVEGEVIVVGDVDDPQEAPADVAYEVLCRQHHRRGLTAGRATAISRIAEPLPFT
jgi:thymidine kinase